MDWKLINEEISDLYDPKQDNITKAHIADTNKPKLTLKNINNLKQLRKAKAIEKEQKSETLAKVYGSSDEESGGDGGMGF